MGQPVTPEASEEARALLEQLYEISGTKILTGQHNQPIHGSSWSEEVYKLTGNYPAVWGQDFGFSPPDTLDGINLRQRHVDQAIAWSRRGAKITFTWHCVCPTDDEPVEFQGGIIKNISEAEWAEILSPGSRLHERWKSQVDVIAFFLKQLQAARVPVLWRPYHEMNGPWFWWGGNPEGLKQLWRMLFQRLTGFHGLDNLIWVWSPNSAYGNAAPFAPFFPGHDVVDVLAVDTYDNHYEQEHYDNLLALAGDKPIALGECGELPSPETLEAQPRWTWFLAWAGMVTDKNLLEFIHRVYTGPWAINLEGVLA